MVKDWYNGLIVVTMNRSERWADESTVSLSSESLSRGFTNESDVSFSFPLISRFH